MSSEEPNNRDEGISDVIALLQNVDVTREANKQTEKLEQDQNRENDTNGISDTRQNGQSEKQNENDLEEDASSKENKAIDLSDPDQIIEMLETVDLTEEDTEVLLQEAYSMNKKLKEILRRQEETNASSKPKSGKRRSRQSGDAPSPAVSSSQSLSNSRIGSASLKKAVLPPIEKETSIYAVKLQRSKTNVAEIRKIPSHAIAPRSKSTKENNSSPTRKSKSKSTEPRPEWNDRFNYS